MPERDKVRWSQLKVGVVGLTAFVILFVLVFLLTSSRGIFQQNEPLYTFMVMREGRLIFEGDQDRLEASTDPYVTKFIKQRV